MGVVGGSRWCDAGREGRGGDRILAPSKWGPEKEKLQSHFYFHTVSLLMRASHSEGELGHCGLF